MNLAGWTADARSQRRGYSRCRHYRLDPSLADTTAESSVLEALASGAYLRSSTHAVGRPTSMVVTVGRATARWCHRRIAAAMRAEPPVAGSLPEPAQQPSAFALPGWNSVKAYAGRPSCQASGEVYRRSQASRPRCVTLFVAFIVFGSLPFILKRPFWGILMLCGPGAT
ncbi:MAG: hypothetical protein U5L05_16030 [Rubrivivax sp.]|nr:hypothetical protein [Rubrivivax sp.]